jgi:hypothetical protein
LTLPASVRGFNLKSHQQLKKKILSTKKRRQIYSRADPTGPPPSKIDFYTRKGHFFFMTWILAWNQLNFDVHYLFLAQFWQILAISSLKLPKNFKFLKIELEMSYITQKKAEIIWKSISWQKNMICLRKKRISWFFGWKLSVIHNYGGQIIKIFKKKQKFDYTS